MWEYCCKKAIAYPDDCCLDSVISDWFLCNMYAGCRGSEWAQPEQANVHLDTYHRNDFGNAYAFTLADIKLLKLNNRPMTTSAALQTPQLVGRVQIRFEQQKNGTNHD